MSEDTATTRVAATAGETEESPRTNAIGREESCQRPKDEPEIDDFGGCPLCLRNDGFLDVGRDHWFICRAHKTKWYGGSNLFSLWREETADDWNKHSEELAEFTEIEPACEASQILAAGPYTYRQVSRQDDCKYEILTASGGRVVAELSVWDCLGHAREHAQLFSSSLELLAALRLAQKCLTGFMTQDRSILSRIHDVITRAESRSPALEVCPAIQNRSIRYHEHVKDDAFEWFASEFGSTTEVLEAETETAIRENFGKAVVRPRDRADGVRPDVYTLPLQGPNGFSVHFSIESDVCVVRGYSWDIGDREPLDDQDGGYICCDNDWFESPAMWEGAVEQMEREYAEQLREEYGPVFDRLVHHFRGDEAKAVEYMENAHAGEYFDLGEYAYQQHGPYFYSEEFSALPEYITNNIDWDRVGKELLAEGGIFVIEGDGVLDVFHTEL